MSSRDDQPRDAGPRDGERGERGGGAGRNNNVQSVLVRNIPHGTRFVATRFSGPRRRHRSLRLPCALTAHKSPVPPLAVSHPHGPVPPPIPQRRRGKGALRALRRGARRVPPPGLLQQAPTRVCVCAVQGRVRGQVSGAFTAGAVHSYFGQRYAHSARGVEARVAAAHVRCAPPSFSSVQCPNPPHAPPSPCAAPPSRASTATRCRGASWRCCMPLRSESPLRR